MERKGRKRYRVVLSDEEREELSAIVRGKASAHRRRHAHILLLADEARAGGGLPDSAIASVLGIGRATAERVRKRCVEEGIEAALERRKQANRKPRKLDGAAEAKLVALACSESPEGPCALDAEAACGAACGTGDRGQHRHGDGAEDAEKNDVKPWLTEYWRIPPKANAAFVCAMEDVLEVVHRAFDDNTVLLYIDETSKQQTRETRRSMLAAPGQPAIVDHEYERNGTANLFMVFLPCSDGDG